MNIVRKIKNLLEVNSFFSVLFEKVTNSFLYRICVDFNVKRYVKKIKKKKNYNIVLETSNLCNAKCVMCPHVKMQRKKGVMSDEIFDLIIQKIQEERISPLAFILNGFGEPLTDKNIIPRMNKIKSLFPKSILKFYSNFGLADDSVIEKLVDSGLDEINISFNGFNKESYEDVMKINYDKTIANVLKLIKSRNDKKSKLKIRMSMALVNSNDGDEKKFIKKWGNKVDSVSINKVHDYGGSVKSVSGKYKINYEKKRLNPCKAIFNSIIFGVTGDIFLCCLDYEGSFNFGSVRDNKILDIFYSKEYENIRKIHLNGDARKLKLCSSCYTPYRNGIDWFIDKIY